MSARLGRALSRWQRRAGPYWPYVCAAPFLASRMPSAARSAADAMSGGVSVPNRWRIGEGLAVFFDLPPVLVLDSTEDLIRIGFYVVPVIQRWPQPSALLPASRLLHALVNFNQPEVLTSPPRGVAFILDGERDGRRFALAPADARLDLRRFDNRYHYTADRFPSPETLRRYGIHRVEWVSEAGVAPDLQPYALDLAAAGLRPQALEPGDVASL